MLKEILIKTTYLIKSAEDTYKVTSEALAHDIYNEVLSKPNKNATLYKQTVETSVIKTKDNRSIAELLIEVDK